MSFVMGVEGFEPPRLAAPEPKSGASTSSATLPCIKNIIRFYLICQPLNLK